jgi:hypothetical protein
LNRSQGEPGQGGVVLRAREILVRRVPVYMLILAVVLTALLTFSVFYAQVPPVVEFVKALRPKTVTVTITDVTFTSVTLEDTDTPPDNKANQAVVVFSTDGPVDGAVRVTVTLRNAAGNILDSGSTTVPVPAAGSYTATVGLNNQAVMANVKSIEISFEQVT